MYSLCFHLQVPLATKKVSNPYKNLKPFYALQPKAHPIRQNGENFKIPLNFSTHKKFTQVLASNGTKTHEIEPKKLAEGLTPDLMPKHIAMTIDGHRRWAVDRGLPSLKGYQLSREKLKKIIHLCADWEIEILNVFLFSVKNWLRPEADVVSSLSAFEKIIELDYQEYSSRGIKMSIIGEKSKLSSSMQRVITSAEEATKHNTGMHLLFGLNYGGRQDITLALRKIAAKVSEGLLSPDDIYEKLVSGEMNINGCTNLPDPDLLIRATGNERLSDFCLWKLAHTQLYFAGKKFPDFEEADFVIALLWFQERQRLLAENDS